MTKAQKLAAVAELSALKDMIPTTADLWLLAEWMFKLKKAFHQYMNQNNLPEKIAGLLYAIDGGSLKIVSNADYAKGISSAKRMLATVIADLKATIDIVDA